MPLTLTDSEVERIYPSLLNLIRRRYPKADAHEYAQQAIFKALRTPSNFEGRCTKLSYICTIALHAIQSHHRSAYSRHVTPMEHLPERQQTPAYNHILLEQILKAGHLTSEESQLLITRYRGNYEGALGSAERVRLCRIIRRLRDIATERRAA